MHAAAIKGSDKPDWLRRSLIRLWLRLREVGHNAFEVVRTDADVRIVDKEKLVARVGSKLRERADFAVGAEARGTLDEADHLIGKFALQLVNSRNRRIVEGGDPKEEFEFAEIVLVAVRAKGVEHVRVKAFERFEDGHTGREAWEWSTPGNEKHPRGNNGHQKIAHSCNGQDCG